MSHPLDNPAWHALQEAHAHLCMDFGNVKMYHPKVLLFGGFVNTASEGLDEYAQTTQNLFTWGEQPDYSSNLRLTGSIPCLQMVLEKPIRVQMEETIVPLVSEEEYRQLYDLVWKVQPGYFQARTPELGAYFGIYQGDQLVAAAGERMKWNDYTEVSAVVTDPDFTGRGYASQLIAAVTDRVFAENKIPCLHVADTNTGAIRLYRKLGFHTRRNITLWKLGKV